MRSDEKPWIVITIGVPDQPREGERYEIGLVVNKIELTSLLKDMGDVEHLPLWRRSRGPRRANATSGCSGDLRRIDIASRAAQRLGQETCICPQGP